MYGKTINMRIALIDLGAKNALNALTASMGLEELGKMVEDRWTEIHKNQST